MSHAQLVIAFIVASILPACRMRSTIAARVASTATADEDCGTCPLNLPTVLSDHLVLQQNLPIKIWGQAPRGSDVCAALQRDKDKASIAKKCSAATAAGRFLLSLPGMPATTDPHTIFVTNQDESLSIHDVVVGEVWLSSGQSNMELEVQYSLEAEDAFASASLAANQGLLRVFQQDDVNQELSGDTSEVPLFENAGGKWLPATSKDNIDKGSAIAYSFARTLFEHFGKSGPRIPVAMIESAVGSTGIQAWISHPSLAADPQLQGFIPKVWKSASNDQDVSYFQGSACFNHKIAPLQNLGIRGFIWSQGESNVGDEAKAALYQHALQTLIKDWRQGWDLPEAPFLLAQLAPTATTFAVAAQLDQQAFLREAQLDAAKAVPLSAALPIHDLDLTWDWGTFPYQHPIHPLGKKQVGQRLGKAALSIAYKVPGEYTGPLYEQTQANAASMLVSFTHVSAGLRLKPGTTRLDGFALAGADRRFVPANAVIKSTNMVEVSSPLVPQPVAVSYGFTAMNQDTNLVNAEGLPASPFRSDRVAASYLRIQPRLRYEAEIQPIPEGANNAAAEIQSAASASRGALLVLKSPKLGEIFSVSLRVISEASYRISVVAMQGPGMGRAQFYLAGNALGPIWDGYAPEARLGTSVLSARLALSPGVYELKMLAQGKNSAAQGTSLSIDAFELYPLGPQDSSVVDAWTGLETLR